MPARVSEAFVLRTYPFQEGDLVVSFFTREQGKLRGVAKRARKLKSPYGAALERLSRARLAYYQRETVELVRLESAELVESQFGLSASYEAGVALDYIAEVTEHLLPPAEANERFFRLLGAVTGDLRGVPSAHLEAASWRAVTYFSYWAVRLTGILPRLAADPLADAIAVSPIGSLPLDLWTKQTGRELRRRLYREIENHVERKLVTVPLLEAL
jgi:DNA repair protein RecO (recombination protein O)